MTCCQLASSNPEKFLKWTSTTWERRSEARNKHLLVIVDRASKFLFAYPLPNKTAENVAKTVLELLLTFGIPLSLRSDSGTEFTAEVVHHLYR